MTNKHLINQTFYKKNNLQGHLKKCIHINKRKTSYMSRRWLIFYGLCLNMIRFPVLIRFHNLVLQLEESSNQFPWHSPHSPKYAAWHKKEKELTNENQCDDFSVYLCNRDRNSRRRNFRLRNFLRRNFHQMEFSLNGISVERKFRRSEFSPSEFSPNGNFAEKYKIPQGNFRICVAYFIVKWCF